MEFLYLDPDKLSSPMVDGTKFSVVEIKLSPTSSPCDCVQLVAQYLYIGTRLSLKLLPVCMSVVTRLYECTLLLHRYITESVDSVCRDTTYTQYMLIQKNLSKSQKRYTYKPL